MPRPRPIVLKALCAIVGLGLVDAVAGWTLLAHGKLGRRPLPPFGVELDVEQRAAIARLTQKPRPPQGLHAFDAELGWCVRPSSSDSTGMVHVNAAGQRGQRDYTALPAAGVRRVACFGDSFTFGDEVQDEFTYPAFLERLEPGIEALNYGVPAYGTDQALLRMRREGIAGARTVVFTLLLENIGRNVNRFRPLWTPRTLAPLCKPRFVLEGTALRVLPQPFATPEEFERAIESGAHLTAIGEHEYWLDRPRLGWARHSSIARLIGGFVAYRARSPEQLWRDVDGEPRRLTLALVEAAKHDATQRGAAEFLVLVLPMREELERYVAGGPAYWTDVAESLRARGIDAIDMAPALADEQRLLDASPSPDGSGGPTLWVAAHLSSVGNQRIAREVLAWMRR